MSVGRVEERRLFGAFRATGDRRDRDAIVERFLPLARQLARSYRAGGEPLERSSLDTLLDTLAARDRLIVRLYFHGDLTQAQIGHRIGCSQMHVSRLLRQAVKQLSLCALEQDDRSVAPAGEGELAA